MFCFACYFRFQGFTVYHTNRLLLTLLNYSFLMWSSSVVGSKAEPEKNQIWAPCLPACTAVLVLHISLQLQLLFTQLHQQEEWLWILAKLLLEYWLSPCLSCLATWSRETILILFKFVLSTQPFLLHIAFLLLPATTSLSSFHPITHLGIGIPSSLFASFYHYEICSFQDQILEPFLHPKLWSFFLVWPVFQQCSAIAASIFLH